MVRGRLSCEGDLTFHALQTEVRQPDRSEVLGGDCRAWGSGGRLALSESLRVQGPHPNATELAWKFMRLGATLVEVARSSAARDAVEGRELEGWS